jgi:hypothetical protein
MALTANIWAAKGRRRTPADFNPWAAAQPAPTVTAAQAFELLGGQRT